jgi:hypothetical protein
MLSYNALYGQPAALMRRRIWSGDDRKLASVSAVQANAFKAAAQLSSVPPGLGVWNGRVYTLVFSDYLYTTPDFKTLTLRLTPGTTFNSVVQRNGTIVASYGSAGSGGTQISTNDGASFTNTAVGHAASSAGEYFFTAYSASSTWYLYRSATGLGTWTQIPMPSGLWSKVLFNGNTYLALSTLNTGPFINAAAWSNAAAAAFTLSDGWSAAIAQFPSYGCPAQAVVVGGTFVLIGAYGNRVTVLRSENGRWFDVHSQVLNGAEGEEFRSPTHACVIDDIIYVRVTSADPSGVNRIRLLVSPDAGMSWRLWSGITYSRLDTPNSNVGAASLGALFPMAPGQGLYYAPGQGHVYGLVSDTVNDREFYYELGAA